MKQISIELPNKPGALAGVCDSLSRAGVNIESLFGGGLDGEGAIHLITRDDTTAQKVLEKAGYSLTVSDILTVKLSNRPGELAKITYNLAHKKINIESIYLLDKDRGETTVALKVNNIKGAQELLK